MPAGSGMALELDKRDMAQLDRALHLVGERVYDKVIGKAANSAMKLVLRAARRRVPVRYGALKKSLGTRRKLYRRNRVVWVGMGPRSLTAGVRWFAAHATGLEFINPPWYAHLVEFGTRPHSISPGVRLTRSRVPSERKAAEAALSGPFIHPGARAQPFMRPAYDETKHAMVRLYSRLLLKGLDKEVRKLARGT